MQPERKGRGSGASPWSEQAGAGGGGGREEAAVAVGRPHSVVLLLLHPLLESHHVLVFLAVHSAGVGILPHLHDLLLLQGLLLLLDPQLLLLDLLLL